MISSNIGRGFKVVSWFWIWHCSDGETCTTRTEMLPTSLMNCKIKICLNCLCCGWMAKWSILVPGWCSSWLFEVPFALIIKVQTSVTYWHGSAIQQSRHIDGTCIKQQRRIDAKSKFAAECGAQMEPTFATQIWSRLVQFTYRFLFPICDEKPNNTKFGCRRYPFPMNSTHIGDVAQSSSAKIWTSICLW